MDIYLGSYYKINNFALNTFKDIYFKKITQNKNLSVVISGGRSPKGLYELLNKDKEIDFSKIYFFISDERITDNETEINYMNIEKVLFKNKSSYNFFKINPFSNNSLVEYNEIVSNFLKDNAFDLLILGIGSDGHIASLFDKFYPQNEYVIKTKAPDRYPIRERITLNYVSLNKANFCIFMVVGEDKKDIKEKIIKNDIFNYPFSLVRVSSKFFVEKDYL